MTKKKSKLLGDQRFIVLLVIIALITVYVIFSKEFRKYSSILSMLDFSYYDILMAIGVTFPLITAGVDLSIGTGMVCYALIGGTLVRNYNCPVAVAMLVCILLGCGIGLLNGVLIGIMGLPPFLATLCTCMITRGIGSRCSATPWPTLKQPGGWFHSIFKLTFGSGRGAFKFPIGIILMVIIVLVMEFVLNHTRFGRYTIAIGSNKEATILSGINVKKYRYLAGMITAVFIAIAGILVSSRGSSAQVMCCDNYLMPSLAAVFVGRTVGGAEKPNALGTLIGAALVSTLENGLTILAVPYYVLPAVKGAVLALALIAAYASKKED